MIILLLGRRPSLNFVARTVGTELMFSTIDELGRADVGATESGKCVRLMGHSEGQIDGCEDGCRLGCTVSCVDGCLLLWSLGLFDGWVEG